ncbi:MAG: YheT family hydrolase [Gammaproteobacteria bacterium]
MAGLHTRRSAFKPAWWLPGGHAQTLYAAYLKHAPRLQLETQIFELPDGDCTRGFWLLPRSPHQPLVMLLPGLEGDAGSPYIRGLARHLARAGYGILILPFRGTRGNPNRRRESYHAGWIGDLDWVVEYLNQEEKTAPLAIIGFSLGGNMLLRWLATSPGAARIQQAIGVSIPFDLSCVAHAMSRGTARLYQAALIQNLRRAAFQKLADHGHPTLQSIDLRKLRTFLDFDGRYVAPLYGFQDAEDYYAQTSSRSILGRIKTPTLILQSLDDPIIPGYCLPEESEWSASTILEWSPHGGHVGFIHGRWPFWGHAWINERITEALAQTRSV